MASPGINSIPSVSGRQPDIMPTLSGAGYGNYPVQNKTYLYSLLIHMLAAALIVAATTYVANNPEKVQQQLQSINLDLSDYVFNAGDSGAGHLGVHGRLSACPHLQDAICAHPTDGVVRLHRRVREIRQLVEGVNRVGSLSQTLVEIAICSGDDGPFSGFDQAVVLAQ